MSLRRQLLVSFVVQGAGAASLLLATLWLASAFGPQVQGGFSRTKTEIEFVAAFALFGLPQALFFHVKSGSMDGRHALRWALGSALLALPIAALYAAWWHHPVHAGDLLMLSLAVGACVAHGQLRALLLVRDGTLWFNTLTAWPQVVVGIGVAGAIAWRLHSPWAWCLIFALAYGTAAGLAWNRLRSPPAAAPPQAGVGWRALGNYGLAAWLTAVMSTAAVLLAQRWVESSEGAAALGRFTLALTLVLVPLVPLAYAAPLLLRRWMEQPDAHGAQRWAAGLCAALLALAAAVWLLALRWPDLGLGPAYEGTTRALAVLLAGAGAEAASRLLTVRAGARGEPWVAVRAELLRWAVLAAAWAWPLPPGLLPKCAAWAAAAWAAALVFAWHARTHPAAARPAA